MCGRRTLWETMRRLLLGLWEHGKISKRGFGLASGTPLVREEGVYGVTWWCPISPGLYDLEKIGNPSLLLVACRRANNPSLNVGSNSPKEASRLYLPGQAMASLLYVVIAWILCYCISFLRSDESSSCPFMECTLHLRGSFIVIVTMIGEVGEARVVLP